jgi:hypothetical protein
LCASQLSSPAEGAVPGHCAGGRGRPPRPSRMSLLEVSESGFVDAINGEGLGQESNLLTSTEHQPRLEGKARERLRRPHLTLVQSVLTRPSAPPASSAGQTSASKRSHADSTVATLALAPAADHTSVHADARRLPPQPTDDRRASRRGVRGSRWREPCAYRRAPQCLHGSQRSAHHARATPGGGRRTRFFEPFMVVRRRDVMGRPNPRISMGGVMGGPDFLNPSSSEVE